MPCVINENWALILITVHQGKNETIELQLFDLLFLIDS